MKNNCTKCGQVKEDSDFPHAKGKRHSWCRACHKVAKTAYRVAFRAANPRKTRIAADYTTSDGKLICPKCKTPRLPEEYREGRVGWCRPCRADEENRKRREAGIPTVRRSRIEGTQKLCMHCGDLKELSDFPPSVKGLGGVGSYCRPCASERYYNKEQRREATDRYRKRHPERHKATHRVRMFERRTRLKVQSDGTVTDEFLKSLYAKPTCFYCEEDTVESERTADHRVPLISEGPHSADNLVMACSTCNSSKRDMTEEEFIRRIKDGMYRKSHC